MRLQVLLALSATLPALAAPIASFVETDKRNVADVATVLIGVTEDRRDVADVATVLIGVLEKRDAAEIAKRDDANVADVATVLIGVTEKREAVAQSVTKLEPAVQGAYANFVEEAEAHPEDILG